jgi:hypothetical protein
VRTSATAELHRERRESGLHAVVKVAVDAAPLGIGGREQAAARRRQLLGHLLALGDERRQAQRRQGQHDDEQLRAEHARRDVAVHERAGVAGGVPDDEAGRDHHAERGAALAEAERRPHQAREHEVEHRLRRAGRELADQGRDHDARDRLGAESAAQRRTIPGEEGERERHRHERAAEVAEQPRAPHRRHVLAIDDVAQVPGQRADGRARHRAGEQREHHPRQVRDRLERRALAHEPVEHDRGHQRLEHVPARLAECGAERQRGVVVREQVAEQDPRPEPQPADVQRRHPDAAREPHDRGDRPGELELVPELRGGVVAGCQREHAPQVVQVRERDPAGAEPCAGLGALVHASTPISRIAAIPITVDATRWTAAIRAIGTTLRSRRPARCKRTPSGGFETDDRRAREAASSVMCATCQLPVVARANSRLRAHAREPGW